MLAHTAQRVAPTVLHLGLQTTPDGLLENYLYLITEKVLRHWHTVASLIKGPFPSQSPQASFPSLQSMGGRRANLGGYGTPTTTDKT